MVPSPHTTQASKTLPCLSPSLGTTPGALESTQTPREHTPSHFKPLPPTLLSLSASFCCCCSLRLASCWVHFLASCELVFPLPFSLSYSSPPIFLFLPFPPLESAACKMQAIKRKLRSNVRCGDWHCYSRFAQMWSNLDAFVLVHTRGTYEQYRTVHITKCHRKERIPHITLGPLLPFATNFPLSPFQRPKWANGVLE